MKPALVKIDVAAVDLGMSVRRIEQMVDGGSKHETGLVWIFNLANDLNARKRDVRFWRPELLARVQGDVAKYGKWKIGQVIASILPEAREKFHAGEVDVVFQIRPNSRIAFGAELNGKKVAGRNSYSRAVLVDFLQRRWPGRIFSHESKGRRRMKNTLQKPDFTRWRQRPSVASAACPDREFSLGACLTPIKSVLRVVWCVCFWSQIIQKTVFGL